MPLPQLVNAVQQFKGDQYSKALRWKDGYSDCSSFISKGMKVLGLKYPSVGNTFSYLASKDWKTIPRSQATAGDIAVNISHMALFTSNTQGIGQQNSRADVQTRAMKDLMYGTGDYVVKTYVGGGAVKASFEGTAQQAGGILEIPGEIGKAFEYLTAPETWIRISIVLGGSVLVLIGVIGLTRTRGVAQTAAKAVTQNAKP